MQNLVGSPIVIVPCPIEIYLFQGSDSIENIVDDVMYMVGNLIDGHGIEVDMVMW